MPGPSRDVQLRLFRDALSTPWGFRLQGGKDIKQPLTVQKVTIGSPVDGELCHGDVILEIQNCDATTMTHQKAQEMISGAGGSLLLRVRRFGYQAPPHAPAPAAAAAANTGEASVTPGQQNFMMHRIQDSLSGMRLCAFATDAPTAAAATAAGGFYKAPPFGFGREEDHYNFHPPAQPLYPALSVVSSKNSQYIDRLYSTLPRQKNSSALPTGFTEPGWTPRGHQGRAQGGARARPNPPPHPTPTMAPPARPRSLEPERPAWEGSLRSSTNPRVTDMRIQVNENPPPPPHHHTREISRFSPGGASSPGYRHSAPWPQGNSDSPRAVNLQYNSPLAMYSRTSANEALYKQTIAKPGLGVSSESDVYSLVHENNGRSSAQGEGARWQTTRPVRDDFYSDF